VSALGILDGGPTSPRKLLVYHNPYASVTLPAEALSGFPWVEQRLLLGATQVNLR
jgi:hypothetical protein